MSKIKALGLPNKIKALGVDTANKEKKSLSIRYISCELRGITLILKVKIIVKGFSTKEKSGVLSISRADLPHGESESVTTNVMINCNGITVLEIDLPKNFGNNSKDSEKKYYRASIIVGKHWALSEGFKLKNYNKSECYCQKQGLTTTCCEGKGKSIVEGMYINLAKRLGVEKEVFYAIAREESKHDAFIKNNPKRANILLERHFVYKLMRKKYGETKANYYKNIDSTLCHQNVTPRGGYGSRSEQLVRLETVKKWDTSVAIKSCSWGKFQIMGEYIEKDNDHLYNDEEDFENAMNICEVQHFRYFVFFIEKIKGKSLINAMRNKNWEDIARKYNGSKWKIFNPNYAKNIKKYYE